MNTNEVTTSICIDSFNFSIKGVSLDNIFSFLRVEYIDIKNPTNVDNFNIPTSTIVSKHLYKIHTYTYEINDYGEIVMLKKTYDNTLTLIKKKELTYGNRKYKSQTIEILLKDAITLKPFTVIINFTQNIHSHTKSVKANFILKGIHSYKTSYMMVYEFIQRTFKYFKWYKIEIDRCDFAFDFRGKGSSFTKLDFNDFTTTRNSKHVPNINKLEDTGTKYIEEAYTLSYRFKDETNRSATIEKKLLYGELSKKYSSKSIKFISDHYLLSLTRRTDNTPETHKLYEGDELLLKGISHPVEWGDIFQKKEYRLYNSYLYDKRKKSKYPYDVVRFEITLRARWLNYSHCGTLNDFTVHFTDKLLRLLKKNKYTHSYKNNPILIKDEECIKYLKWFIKYIISEDVETPKYLLQNDKKLIQVLEQTERVSNSLDKNTKPNISKVAKETSVSRSFVYAVLDAQ